MITSDRSDVGTTTATHSCGSASMHISLMVYLGMSDRVRAYIGLWFVCCDDESSHLVAEGPLTSGTIFTALSMQCVNFSFRYHSLEISARSSLYMTRITTSLSTPMHRRLGCCSESPILSSRRHASTGPMCSVWVRRGAFSCICNVLCLLNPAAGRKHRAPWISQLDLRPAGRQRHTNVTSARTRPY